MNLRAEHWKEETVVVGLQMVVLEANMALELEMEMVMEMRVLELKVVETETVVLGQK